jgi:PKD domain
MLAMTMSDRAISIRLPARDRRRRVSLLIGFAALVLALGAQRADAVILPAVTIDGPSEDIVGFGGAAMAEDGTGGLVYLKRVGGVAHVFVSRYADGHWMAPMRVDTEQPFAASWPRIGAANGGELVVVWAMPFATRELKPVDELLGATLGPGSGSFGPATIVDPEIGEGTGTSPDLAMSSTGQADVVYRAVETQTEVPLLRRGDVNESVRVAHFNGERWSDLGAINRDPGLSMRPPTAANAPQIAIGPTGNGVVVWQEPELSGVARLWARRLFGQGLDYVMPVSAAALGGSPIEQDADAPSVTLSRLGEAEVAYRQVAGAGSPLAGARIFLNVLPDGESASGAEFQGPAIADNSVAGGKAASVGRPSIDMDERRSTRIVYDSNGTPRVIEGTDKGLSGTLSLGPAFVGSQLTPASELESASVMNPEGGGISAWPSADQRGDPAVAVREDFSEGGVQTGLVSGGAGGPIGELAVGRSSLGDGLVAFQQGPLGDAAIVAAQVTAPPDPFVITLPKGWVKPAQAQVVWAPASSANGPLTYTVVLDGHRLRTPAGAASYHFSRQGLGDGVHEVQVLATDIFGQSTLTAPSELEVEGLPPSVAVTRANGGHGVTVRVSDSRSGVNVRAVSVSFGDGHGGRGHKSFHHVYAHPGVYMITVKVRSKLGNQDTVRRLVKAL